MYFLLSCVVTTYSSSMHSIINRLCGSQIDAKEDHRMLITNIKVYAK